MRKNIEKRGLPRRILALALALVMVAGYLPGYTHAAEAQEITKVTDNSTWGRLETIHDNNTLRAGKVTVDKSVSTGNASGQATVDGQNINLKDADNFLVTVSQTAQVMALTTEMQVPVDVVFVLDTSGSMGSDGREASMVAAANSAIKTLMAANSHNRVGVVAFSDIDGSGWNVTPAATVLTRLDHYDAFDNHLTYSGSNLVGRGTGAGRRDGSNGGTNIQAGVAMGAQMLANATDITVDGVTRIPFLIILSDGAPTYNFSDSNWYNPSMTGSQYGPGNDNGTLYAGNGFLPALVAAYYKGVITEHYYGNSASEDNRCSIYSLGVSIDNSDLARLTMDPKTNFNANATGNSHSGRFATYWRNYQGGSSFNISSGYGESLTISQNSINATKNYVNGISSSGKKMYEGSIRYNDGYYSANNTEEINGIFDSVIEEIAHKAISAPTRVTTTAEFDGYVTFTDVIGEYMEVKQMHGVLVGDTFYQGRHVARNIGTNGSDADFDAMLRNVIATRITMADSNVSKEVALQRADALIAASVGATYNGQPTQAFYNESTNEYSNSVVWFGKSFNSADGFEHGVQYISPAVDDSYEYLTDSASAAAINAAKNAGADTVCRSYFLYGTAETAGGNQTSNHNNQYMYFMIRVERSLTAPYQQTVTVSAPASLLSMEKVYVTEDATTNPSTYTVEVEENDPAHVIYEVGLRSDINEYNVATKVGDYADEAPTDGIGHVNYEDGTYYFFTNDWDRDMAADSHTRAQSKATFYAAANNPYYTYQEKTYLYQKSGSRYIPYTGSNPQGMTLYYMRDVYSWGTQTNDDGELIATFSQVPIEVTMPSSIPADSTAVAKDDNGWYIAAGVYTAAFNEHDGTEHVAKGENKTETSIAVAHPKRTGDADDAHYTVYLGNNGVMGLKPAEAKTVSIDLPANAVEITDDNGKPVMVGQTLTYTIDVVNTTDKTATVTAVDTIPFGTTLVEGSVTEGGVVSDRNITWTFRNMAPGAHKTVSFRVLVTEDVLTGEVETNYITNTATVKIGDNVLYETNTTHNPPEGKKAVAGSDTNVITGPLKVGDTITYRIRYYNDAVDASGNPVAADITITDIIPAGTTYYPGSASHQESLIKGNDTDLTKIDGKDGLKWVIEDVRPGASGTVSFRVVVDASAVEAIENDASIKIGDNDPHDTNKTSNEAGEGEISISKSVVSEFHDEQTEFSLILTETGKKLTGTFQVDSNLEDRDTTVTFANGVNTSELKIRHGEKLTVKGLPLGAEITVAEGTLGAGWSNSFTQSIVVATAENADTEAVEVPNVGITNTYRVDPIKFQLKGTKNFQGANFPADITFTFDAVETDENGNVKTGGVRKTATVTSETGKTSKGFQFEASTFTGNFERYYKITEKAVSNLNGLTTSTQEYYLHLKVEENRDDAILELTARYKVGANGNWTALNLTKGDDGVYSNSGSEFTFVNTYEPLVSDPVEIPGTKSLTGRYLSQNDFSFQLVKLASEGSSDGTVIDTVTNGAGTEADPSVGSFKFAPIVYTAADMGGEPSKTFYYVVREVQGDADNTTYDRTLYYVSVTVEDKDGKLVAGDPVITQYVWNFDENKYELGDGTSIVYTNEFKITNASVVLGGNKLFTGDGAEKLDAEDFTFSIYSATVDNEGNWIEGTKVAAAGNEAGTKVDGVLTGSFTFSPINYTPNMFADVDAVEHIKTKHFYYIIKEDIPKPSEPSWDSSMVYADDVYKVEVVATYNVATGSMEAKIVSVNGASTGENGVESFNALTFNNVRNKQEILYTPVGEKVIMVKEGKPLPSNLRFSFRVTDLLTGTVEGTGISQPVAADDAGNLVEIPDIGGEDTIRMLSYGTGITFTGMEYDYSDVGQTFWYVIEEATVSMSDGVTYDPTQYILKITVKKNDDPSFADYDKYPVNGLYIVDEYYELGYEITTAELAEAVRAGDSLTNFIDEMDWDISFSNHFDAEYTLDLSATKDLSGRPLKDNEFLFSLRLLEKASANGSYTLTDSVINGSNAASGAVSFGTMNFTTAQMTDGFKVDTRDENGVITTTYEYNVLLTELAPESAKLAGVEYDDSRYIVAIRWEKVETPVTDENGQVVSTQTTYGEPYVYATYEAVDGEGEGTVAKKDNDPDKDGLDPLKTTFDKSNNVTDLGITYKNVYTVRTGTRATITAKKVLTGRPLAENEFVFDLYRYDTQTDTEVFAESATNKAGGVITFTRAYPANIDLDKYFVNNVATFVYHITELNNAMGGITYFGDDFWVKVVVTHDPATASLSTTSVEYFHTFDKASESFPEKTTDADGNEIANKIESADDVKFINAYEVSETSYTPTGNKVLLGADTDKDGKADVLSLEGYSFSFEVVQTDDKGNVVMVNDVAGKPHAKVVATGNSNADGTITFTSIKFNHADAAAWIQAGKSSQDYYFMIREDQGNAEGVTYSGGPVYLKLKLNHDGNGGLSVSDPVYYSDAFQTAVDNAVFENHYGPGYTVLNLELNKTVVIEGRNDAYPFGESDFNFIMYADDGDGLYDAAKDTTELHRGTNGLPVDHVAPISLGSLIYTPEDMVDETGADVKEKTFYYHIVESDVETAGIEKDPGVITVKVVVTHDGYGNLTATASYTKYNVEGVKEMAEDKQNLFTNVYTAAPAKLSLKGSKTLINKILNQNEFTFVITEDANNPMKVFGEGGKKEVTNGAGDPYRGEVIFLEDLELKLPGEYTFTVTEKNEGAKGYTYDPTVYIVKVQVIDTYTGTLEVARTNVYVGEVAEENLVGGITFTNTYTPDSLTNLDLDLSISARKQIVDKAGNVVVPGEDNDMLSGFYFEILDNKGNSVFGEDKYGVSNAQGEVIDFPAFNFDTAGEYHYIIREVDNEDVKKPGYVYDTTEWALHILVRYNDGSKEVTYQDGDETVTVPAGQLYIIPSEVHTFPMVPTALAEDQDADQVETEPLFSNVYDPTPASVTITADKELTGREMKDHEFTFQLVDSKGLIHGQAGNHADGKVSFTVNYTLADMVDEKGQTVKEKTFNYTIVEVIPQDATGGKLNGVTYATTGKTVSVKVVDEDGVLKVDGKSETTVSSNAVFTNTYKADSVTAEILATKTLTGADVKAFTFDFELVDAAGKAETAHNDASGKISFKKTYSFDDMVNEKGERVTEKVFTYTLREKAGTLAGMTYDKDEITVTVTVTDDLKGKLNAEVTYSAAAVFENSYEGPTAVAVIEATKVLTGKSLKGDDFTFEIVDADGKVVAEAKNDDKGNIYFTLQYEAAGEHVYTLREKAGEDKRIAYDTNTYKVTVTVSADKDGYLSTAVKYDTTDGKAPAFKNTFTPEAVELVIEATKTLSGRKMKAEEFKFRIHDSQGNLVATGTNDAEGKITFSTITFKQAGSYELTVSEVNSGARGMTYDKTKFKVTVEVTEEDGEMSMKVTYPEKGIKFENKYKKPTTSVATGDDTDLSIWLGLMTVSMAAILLIVMDPYMKRKGRFSR